MSVPPPVPGKSAFRRWYDGLWHTGPLPLVIVALVIGVLGGYSAVGFRLFIRLVNRAGWHQGPYTLEHIASLPFWWKLLVPTGGGIIVGLIVHYVAREAKGHGVPEVLWRGAPKLGSCCSSPPGPSRCRCPATRYGSVVTQNETAAREFFLVRWH